MKTKKIILIIIAILIVAGLIFALFRSTNKNEKDLSKIQVVSSNFASYDFLRAIIGDNDNVELTFLIGPGKDEHSYDPTTGDLTTIKNADLFVYIGGEMEKWADRVLETADTNKGEIMCISDFADIIEEQEIDGAEEDEDEEEEEGAFDEHIWTSPSNAIKMVEALSKKMQNIDKQNSNLYEQNAKNYMEKINEVDKEIQDIVDNRVRDRLVFGDKMPMQYFMNYYHLKVSAAFNGCSTETEPSAATMVYLEDVVREEDIPVVLYIELNNGRVADTIANETGARALQIQTLHNVSLQDFESGETWVSLMKRNEDVLRAALQ